MDREDHLSKIIDVEFGKVLPMVVVEWLDAESTDEWEDREMERSIKPIKTVGHLVEEKDDQIVVAMNFDASNDKISMVMVIPTDWIIEYMEF